MAALNASVSYPNTNPKPNCNTNPILLIPYLLTLILSIIHENLSNKWNICVFQFINLLQFTIEGLGSLKELNMFHNYESMKLRKSLVKPVMRQKTCIISSCSVLQPEIIMHDVFNVLWTSTDICIVNDDLGWKNQTTRYNRFCRAGCSQLEYVDIRSKQSRAKQSEIGRRL